MKSDQKLTKITLGKVGVGSNIAQNQSSSLEEVISGHYLPQVIYMYIKIRLCCSHFKYCSKSLI